MYESVLSKASPQEVKIHSFLRTSSASKSYSYLRKSSASETFFVSEEVLSK